jgi:CHASE3 domain sensor protein
MAQGHWQGTKRVEDQLQQLHEPIRDATSELRKIETRVAAIEAVANKSELRTWAFWLALAGVALALVGVALAIVALYSPKQ